MAKIELPPHLRLSDLEKKVSALQAKTLELSAQLRAFMQPETPENLSEQLMWFCHTHKLPFQCALELSHRDDLTPQQRQWLRKFIIRWDALV
jgi:hypothetical protein